MMRKFFFVLIISICPSIVFAQYRIQSTVFDATNGGVIEGAGIRLMNAKDSSYVNGTQTDAKGSFTLAKVLNGQYILEVSFVGYKTQTANVTVEDKNVPLKSFRLVEDSKLLDEVVVKGTAAQMTVKGDTIEFNAAAFKMGENTVVEDLLKRLPGVEITSEGKITVNGETVTKIRVDGKKFFDGDAEMATKNIPADAIEKIQVLEQKSEMAQLTGFEDDATERIINLTFKANRKKGQFGNATAGAGFDVDDQELRYDGNAFLNIIDGDYQSTITAGANNVNTARSSRGRGGFNTNTGISENQNVGFNISGISNPKLSIGGDLSGSHTRNTTDTESNRETYLDTITQYNTSIDKGINNMWRTNARFEAEWKIDSMNTFIFQPDLNYSRTITNSRNDFLYLMGNDTTSDGFSKNDGTSNNYGANLRTTYNHKFAKKGRTLTARLGFGFSNTDRESYNYSKREGTRNELIDQKIDNTSSRKNIDLRLSWVEPLWNVNHLLEIVANLESNFNESEKKQYKDTVNAGIYDHNDTYVYDNEYSNSFSTDFFTEGLELNYRFTQKLYNLTVGVMFKPSQTHNIRTYANGFTRDTTYGVVNFSPTMRFQYNFEKKKFIRFDYRGRTSQPSIDQMQPVKNNSNLMSETVGNPNLNPSFAHNFRLFYSAFNQKTFSSFTTMFFTDLTQNAMVNNSIYDKTGKRYSQTINAKNIIPLSLGGNVNFNTPLIQKHLQFNTNTNANFNKQYGYNLRNKENADINVEKLILGELSRSKNLGLGERLALTFTNDIIEIGVNGSLRYSKTKSDMNATIRETETYDWTTGGNVVLHLPYKITVSSDVNYTTRRGYTSDFDQKEVIWNASIDKSLFKNKAVISLKAFDILQQRLNIRQNVGDNYIQNTSYNTLQSYVLLSFSYKFNRYSGMSTSEVEQRNQRGGDNRWGGGGMPGGRPPM